MAVDDRDKKLLEAFWRGIPAEENHRNGGEFVNRQTQPSYGKGPRATS